MIGDSRTVRLQSVVHYYQQPLYVFVVSRVILGKVLNQEMLSMQVGSNTASFHTDT